MKNSAGQMLLRSRYPLAVAAGLAWAGAFLEIGLAGLAWLAPALVLAAAHGKQDGEAFRIGYVAGLSHFLAALHWLLLIPVKGYPILGWIALSAYLALYPAAWVWLMSSFSPPGAGLIWARRMAWAVFGAVAWVALEMIQARLFSGFPWNLLGASQSRMLPLIQAASVTGVYGVSFLIVWVSLSLYLAGVAILRQPTTRHSWLGEVVLPGTALVTVFAFGWAGLREPVKETATLRVAFIQPSIPQTMIWDGKENDNRFRQLLELTSGALTHPTDLVLWPEAAVPNMIRYDEPTFRAVTDLARSSRVWMIIGCDDAEPRADNANEADYFNGSFLVSPEGDLAEVYHKRHLVIFGEYLPLARWLPFVKWFTPITGSFTPGKRVVPFALGLGATSSASPASASNREPDQAGSATNASVKTAPLICFEDVFPHRVRKHVTPDTDFLVNLTNDGWFGAGVAQWQHAAGAAFRAVENGLPLLRCCNNGLTCWIDSRGRMRAIFRDASGSVHGPGTMTASIPLLAPGEKRTPTFYNQHGDWFGWSCLGLAALLCLRQLTWRKANEFPHPPQSERKEER